MNPQTTPQSAIDFPTHAYAVEVSGYTVVPAQVSKQELDELRTNSEQALEAARAASKAGRKLAYTGGTQYYEACRCMYCWGDACVRLLEHESIHALASLLMGSYLLWDMAVMSALPTPANVEAATTSWHRDFAGMHLGAHAPGYLWFFLCLDDVTAENGATWVVPGSHRLTSRFEPELKATWSGDDLQQFPSRIQVCARAGDLLILNPAMLHTSGRNATPHPRRLLNVGVCHESLQPLLDHWTIAGPAIQSRASERLKKFLSADRKSLDTTWSVLPNGWQTGRP